MPKKKTKTPKKSPTPTKRRTKGEPRRRVAVGLARCSTDHQEHSVSDQVAEIKAWAESHAHELLEVFEDEGISGAELDRPGVRALLHYLESAPEKGVLVAWKRNRLARPEDPRAGLALELRIEQLGWRIHYLHGAQQSGNQLVDTLMGVIEHHEAGQFLRNLATDTLRGLARRAATGAMTTGKTPYGLAKQLTDPEGQVRVIPRGKRHRKLREETIRFVEGDEGEIATVRWIFEQCATGEASALGLAKILNERGVPAPSGRLWGFRSVQNVVRNRVYQGDHVWNMRSTGRFFRLRGGKPVPTSTHQNEREPERTTNYLPNDPKDWIVIEGHHEALVSRSLFRRANEAMAARSRRPKGRQRMASVYPLSGLLYCGNCGAPMTGRTTNSGKKKKWQKRGYLCSNGSDRKACELFFLRADVIEPLVLRKIREIVFSGETPPESLESAMRAAAKTAATDKSPIASEASLRRSLDDLEHKIERAVENLGTLRGHAAELLAEQVNSWSSELDIHRERLSAAQAEREDQPSAEDLFAEAMDLIEEIGNVTFDSAANRRRTLFRRVIQ